MNDENPTKPEVRDWRIWLLFAVVIVLFAGYYAHLGGSSLFTYFAAFAGLVLCIGMAHANRTGVI